MDDMNESMDRVEQVLGSSLRRREFLTKAAAAGAITWATPVILSRAASAADGGGGTPGCRPTFTFECDEYDCTPDGGAQKAFPGFRIVTSCRCSHTGPGCQTTPTTCIRITCISACGTGANAQALVAYANGTDCGSVAGGAGTNVVVSTGCWQSFDASQQIFFGPVRSGNPNNPQGAIPALGSSCCIRFRMSVWAGGCCDETGDPAFNCQTYNVVLDWNQGTKTVDCEGTSGCGTLGSTVAPDAQSCCPTTNPQISPCLPTNPDRCMPPCPAC